MRLAAGSLLPAAAAAHGVLTLPASRNGGSLDKACAKYNIHEVGWYVSNTTIPGQPTNCEFRTLTTPPAWGGCAGGRPPASRGPSPGGTQPWYAPGTAAVLSPCGTFTPNGWGPPQPPADNPRNHKLRYGTDLKPAKKRAAWEAGSAARVGWAAQNNHGGGYAYRLCAAGAPQTEECFQRTHLRFASSTSTVRWTNGTEVAIPAVDLSEGTHPPGSMWRRNSIPGVECGAGALCFGPEPCPGCSGDANHFSVVDLVSVPADLPPGDYTLSWRWDCEINPQVWSNCADVTVSPPS